MPNGRDSLPKRAALVGWDWSCAPIMRGIMRSRQPGGADHELRTVDRLGTDWKATASRCGSAPPQPVGSITVPRTPSTCPWLLTYASACPLPTRRSKSSPLKSPRRSPSHSGPLVATSRRRVNTKPCSPAEEDTLVLSCPPPCGSGAGSVEPAGFPARQPRFPHGSRVPILPPCPCP